MSDANAKPGIRDAEPVCRAKVRGSCHRLLVLAALALVGSSVAGLLVAHSQRAEAYSEPPLRFERLDTLIAEHPGAPFFPLGDSINVDGLERELGYAVTKDSPHKVAERYRGIWESQGLRVNARRHGEQYNVVAWDETDLWLRAVVVSPTARGSAIVASVRSLADGRKEPSVPVLPACAVRTHHGAMDRGIETQAVLLVCDAYPTEIVDFYDAQLAASKRQELTSSPEEGAVHLSYVRAGLEVTLTVSRLREEPPLTAVDLIWQEER